MLLPSLFSLYLLVLQSIQAVEAFSFTTNGNPTSCDNLALTWTGGSPPFSLFVAPIFGTFRNVSIPANAQNSYNYQIPFAKGIRFTITMSDATGFATGGTTNLLETGAPTGGTCNTVDPGTDFDFSLDSALQQCSPYPITGYNAAIQPVRIIGTIPGGQSFVLTPLQGPAAFSWNANVAAGTGIIFSMTDAAGRNGGSSDIKTVGLTNNNACLSPNSPSSTSARPTVTSTSATSKSATKTHASTTSPSASASETSEPEKKTSIAAIAGTVIGALVFLAVAITLGLFFLRRRQEQQKGYGVRRKSRADVDLAYEPPYPPQGGGSYPYTGAAAASTTTGLPYSGTALPYDSNPFLDQHGAAQDPASAHYPPPSTYGQSQYAPSNYAPSQYSSTYQLPSQFPQQGSQYPPSAPSTASDPFNPYMANQPPPPLIQPFDIHTPPEPSSSRDSMSVSMTSTQRKAAMAGVSTYTPSRFIMHTDAEDELPVPNSEGVVELPPQYTERRGPSSLATSSTPAPAERPS